MTLTYFPLAADYGAFPQGGVVNGSITFTPNVPVGSLALVTDVTPAVGEVSAPTQASIVNNTLQTSPTNGAPVFLRADTSDLNLTAALQYTASFTVQVDGQLVPMRDFVFNAQVPRTTTDAAMTSASTTLTSATAAFTSNDVGAVVTVTGAIPTDTVVTIASVTNSTTAVLSSGATATVSSAGLSICQTLNLIEVTPPAGITAFGIVAKGDPGQDLRIDGVVATYSALPSSRPDGDVWLVQADNKLYVRMGGAWPANGSGIPLRGPQGDPGLDGQPQGMYAGTIGNGVLTTIPVTHNRGTQDLIVGFRLVSTGEVVDVDPIVHLDNNSFSVTFATAPATDSIRVVVIGGAMAVAAGDIDGGTL